MLHYTQVKALQEEKLRRYASKTPPRGDGVEVRKSPKVTRTGQAFDWLGEARRSVARFLGASEQGASGASSA